MRRVEPRDIGMLLAVAVMLGVGLVYYERALSHLDDRAAQNSALSFSDREVAGGNSIVIDQEAVYQARALIPRDASYRVVTGDRLQNATSLTAEFVESWYRYFLLPRRPAPGARWIICYGCDTSKLGAAYAVRWSDDNGISIGSLG
jgi:hypothetical protein